MIFGSFTPFWSRFSSNSMLDHVSLSSGMKQSNTYASQVLQTLDVIIALERHSATHCYKIYWTAFVNLMAWPVLYLFVMVSDLFVSVIRSTWLWRCPNTMTSLWKRKWQWRWWWSLGARSQSLRSSPTCPCRPKRVCIVARCRPSPCPAWHHLCWPIQGKGQDGHLAEKHYES